MRYHRFVALRLIVGIKIDERRDFVSVKFDCTLFKPVSGFRSRFLGKRQIGFHVFFFLWRFTPSMKNWFLIHLNFIFASKMFICFSSIGERHERVAQQMKFKKRKAKWNALNYGHMLGGGRSIFYLFNFSFQHWHIYIHFWPRFFMLRIKLDKRSERGDLCAPSK